MWATFKIAKQLLKVNNHPNGRKFAQSGHADGETLSFLGATTSDP
jgi:hypothetical protein